MQQGFREPQPLLQALGVAIPAERLSREAANGFAMRVTASYARQMRPGDADDPLLRQVLPLAEELLSPPGFSEDPVGDGCARQLPGLLQKYPGRALLLVTAACPLHCRYCFRRAYPYAGDRLTGERLEAILAQLRGDPTLHELILSGGDPLMVEDQRLAALLERLATLPQLRRVRIHSRVPVALPERITPQLCSLLAGYRLPLVLVLHCNHPRELSPEVAEGLAALRRAGVSLLNQAVLLRGVNADQTTLCELSERLFACGVLPYYLHLLDRVTGSAHFAVSAEQGRELIARLRHVLPGYLVPRLVREVAGEGCKTPV